MNKTFCRAVFKQILLIQPCAMMISRENLNSREGQPDSTTMDEYYYIWDYKRRSMLP